MPAKPHVRLELRQNSKSTRFLESRSQASQWRLQWHPKEGDQSSMDRLLGNYRIHKPGRHSHVLATWYRSHTTRRLSSFRQGRWGYDLQPIKNLESLQNWLYKKILKKNEIRYVILQETESSCMEYDSWIKTSRSHNRGKIVALPALKLRLANGKRRIVLGYKDYRLTKVLG